MHEKERTAIIGAQTEFPGISTSTSTGTRMKRCNDAKMSKKRVNSPLSWLPRSSAHPFTCRPDALPSVATPSRRFHAVIDGSPEIRLQQIWEVRHFQFACEYSTWKTGN